MSKLEVAAFGGKHTADQILLEAMNDSDKYESVCMVLQDKDGNWFTSWSDQEASKLAFAGQLLMREAMRAATEDE